MTTEQKSQLFKKAHKVARRTSKIVGNYMLAFKLALKALWLQKKFVQFEKKLYEKNIAFTKKSPIRKLSRMARFFENLKTSNGFSFKKPMNYLDEYFFDIGMSLNEKRYITFCTVFNEKKVNTWLGVE